MGFDTIEINLVFLYFLLDIMILIDHRIQKNNMNSHQYLNLHLGKNLIGPMSHWTKVFLD